MRIKISMFIVYAGMVLHLAAASVAVLDAGGQSSDLDILVETIKALGHQAEKLPEEDLALPTGLHYYDCVILAHRSGPLTEAGYQALDQYVREGGTLLLTGLAAYRMKTPAGPRPNIQIRGAGPLKDTVGTVITGAREMPIKRLKLMEKAPAVMGLPGIFALQTSPAYDIHNHSNWRYAGVFAISAETATTLVKAEAVGEDGNIVESDFLTVKQYGRGRSYRLALCRIVPLVFERREKHISLILQNILNESRQCFNREQSL